MAEHAEPLSHLLPHTAPDITGTRLFLQVVRRMGVGGLNDAHAANMLIGVFGLSFRRPLVLAEARGNFLPAIQTMLVGTYRAIATMLANPFGLSCHADTYPEFRPDPGRIGKYSDRHDGLSTHLPINFGRLVMIGAHRIAVKHHAAAASSCKARSFSRA